MRRVLAAMPLGFFVYVPVNTQPMNWLATIIQCLRHYPVPLGT